MPIPITIHRQRVQRHQLIARRHQRPNHQPPIGLDPDQHLRFVLVVPHTATHQLMNLGEPRDPVRHPTPSDHLTLDVEHAHVVMAFGPIDPDKQHAAPPRSAPPRAPRRSTAS